MHTQYIFLHKGKYLSLTLDSLKTLRSEAETYAGNPNRKSEGG